MGAKKTRRNGPSQHRLGRPVSRRGGRVAILSHILPPAPSGQAAVLERLLRVWDPDEYCLISAEPAPPDSQDGAALPGHAYRVPTGCSLPVPRVARLRRLASSANLLLRTVHRAAAITCILHRESCQAIVACTGDLIDLPAGYLAARWSGVPFYIHMFDDYERQWVAPRARCVAKRIMPHLMQRVEGVIVTNEFLRDEYIRRYGVEATVVRNPCNWPPPPLEEATPWPEDLSEIKIVYTGSIYGAQLNAFVDLIGALRKLGRSHIRLHVYTSQDPEELASHGISGPVDFHEHVSRDAVREIQRRSDLLFLPLAFDSPYEKGLIETSAPGKMAEYLASGRPTLVYAPPESFVAHYFREHGCGAVVDCRSVDDLSAKIGKLVDDGEYRERITQSASERAVADFDLAKAQRVFRGALLGVRGRRI